MKGLSQASTFNSKLKLTNLGSSNEQPLPCSFKNADIGWRDPSSWHKGKQNSLFLPGSRFRSTLAQSGKAECPRDDVNLDASHHSPATPPHNIYTSMPTNKNQPLILGFALDRDSNLSESLVLCLLLPALLPGSLQTTPSPHHYLLLPKL